MTLRVLQERGAIVNLAVATSGASGVDDADCTPPTASAKAALREEEQRVSCRLFGLPEERLRFLRLAEGDAGHPVADDTSVARVGAELADAPYAEVFEVEAYGTGDVARVLGIPNRVDTPGSEAVA